VIDARLRLTLISHVWKLAQRSNVRATYNPRRRPGEEIHGLVVPADELIDDVEAASA
jgi:hypothetical protein